MTELTADDKARRDELKKALGHSLILELYAALRVGRFHSMENAAAHQALDRLAAALDALFDLDEEVSVLFYAKDFYVNDTRISPTREDFPLFEQLAAEMKRRGVGGIRLAIPPSQGDLAQFVSAFRGVPDSALDAYALLASTLLRSHVRGITVAKYSGGASRTVPTIDRRSLARQQYFRAVDVAQKLYHQARRGKTIAIKSAKRMVQGFMDLYEDPIPDYSDLLVLLTQVKNWQGYLFNHAVNTCVLSLALGHAIGLRRESLRDLGVAALLADVGNALLPSELLDSPSPLSEDQWERFRMHPVHGVSAIALGQDMDRLLMRVIATSLSHHRTWDGGGYPVTDDGERPGLFAQIVAVCDSYDAMTTPRPYRPRPLTPPRALEVVARGAGKEFNPLVVRAFIQSMGTVPAGTVVLLTTGEIGLVMRSRSQLREGDVTRIRVLMRGSGTLEENRVLELEDPANSEHQVMQVIGAADEAIHNLKANAILGESTG